MQIYMQHALQQSYFAVSSAEAKHVCSCLAAGASELISSLPGMNVTVTSVLQPYYGTVACH